MIKAVIASGNSHKVQEFFQMFTSAGIGSEVVSGKEFLARFDREYISPPETGETFYENSLIKAQDLYQQLKECGADLSELIIIADDSGLVVDALDGAPGVYSARYGSCDGENASDQDNINKLLENMKDVPSEDRSAAFVCHMTAITGDGKEIHIEEKLEGLIGYEPKGDNGFGYDPVMFIPSCGLYVAQMEAKQKNKISHRGKALKKLTEVLYGLYSEV